MIIKFLLRLYPLDFKMQSVTPHLLRGLVEKLRIPRQAQDDQFALSGKSGILLGVRRLLISAIILLVRAYRYCLSPFIGNACRFYPSCSCYAEEAFKRHGVIKGGYLTIYRLLRCHPWCAGGLDLVP